MNKVNIYSDLDSIFDTRYPIIEFTGISVDEYVGRHSDNFRYIGSSFKRLYKNRNRNHLFRADVTRIPIFIELAISDKIEQLELEEETADISVTINIYPYILNDMERKGLEESIINWISYVDEVNIIYKEPDRWVTEEYSIVVMYDGMSFIEYLDVIYNIVKNPIVDLLLIVPGLVDDETIVTNYDKFFEDLTVSLSPICDIQFIDISNYIGSNILRQVSKEEA